MRSSWMLSVLPLLLPACSTSSYVVATADDRVVSVDDCADDLARADVVVLGELHRTPAVHRTHHALIRELHERRPNLVIAMEMFERDAQTVLLQYLTGFVDESGFLARARPWPDYTRDYRPIVEFAKANGLVVLAANAPRALARKAASEGIGVVLGDPHVARETNAPEDDYWEAFREAMKDHPGTTPATLQRQYAAQCLKDDTMAESITDHLAERAEAGDRPLVVLVCGSFHAEHGRGTVARIRSRMPDLDVRVLTAETVDDLSRGIYQSPRGVGDYVVVVERAPGGAEPPADAPAPVAAVPEPAPAATAPTPVTARAPADVGDAAGGRPGLGLRPAYDTGTEGVLVDAVSPGGGAEAAGIEPGDVLVELAGTKIEDVRHYAELLAEQTIGKTIPVRVRRDGAEVVLRVRVGVSAR